VSPITQWRSSFFKRCNYVHLYICVCIYFSEERQTLHVKSKFIRYLCISWKLYLITNENSTVSHKLTSTLVNHYKFSINERKRERKKTFHFSQTFHPCAKSCLSRRSCGVSPQLSGAKRANHAIISERYATIATFHVDKRWLRNNSIHNKQQISLKKIAFHVFFFLKITFALLILFLVSVNK